MEERPIIERDEAYERGLKRFYTGIECHYGHDSERYTSTGGCVECSRLGPNKTLSREDARAQGKFRYFTGGYCWRGHRAARFTSTGLCVDCSARKPSKKLPAGVEPEYE